MRLHFVSGLMFAWVLIMCRLLHIENRIGNVGAKALGESLKKNNMLTSLNLSCMSSFRGWIDVCMGVDGCSR